MDSIPRLEFHHIVDEICRLKWGELTQHEMVCAAWAYYFFSVQFRENLLTARELFPDDENLKLLELAECCTDNLSPWPGVAAPGEKMNHDEFMNRTLALHALDPSEIEFLRSVGADYLERVRNADPLSRALSIASYEDGGLERVFTAMLGFKDFNTDCLRAFEHFLAEHIRFDSDPDGGHGALSRHLMPDDRILPLWVAFKNLFVTCVPGLAAVAA
jgi:hypothetical protein